MFLKHYIHELEDLEKKNQNISTIVVVALVALTTIKKCVYEEYNFMLIFILLIHMYTVLYSLPTERKNLRIYIVGLTLYVISYIITYHHLGSVYLFFIGIEFALGAFYNITKNRIVLFSALIVLFFSFLNYLDVGQYINENNRFICFLIHFVYWMIASVIIMARIMFLRKKTRLTARFINVGNEYYNYPENVNMDRVDAVDLDELVQVAFKNHAGFTIKFKELFPFFTQKIEILCYSLVPTEFEVIALLKLNLTTKEIAQVTGSSVRAIESKKYRIRKKLNIPSDVDMSIFLSKF